MVWSFSFSFFLFFFLLGGAQTAGTAPGSNIFTVGRLQATTLFNYILSFVIAQSSATPPVSRSQSQASFTCSDIHTYYYCHAGRSSPSHCDVFAMLTTCPGPYSHLIHHTRPCVFHHLPPLYLTVVVYTSCTACGNNDSSVWLLGRGYLKLRVRPCLTLDGSVSFSPSGELYQH